MSTKSKIRKAVQLIVGIVCAWAVQPQAQATSISITNPNFEVPVLNGGVTFPNSLNDANNVFFSATGWKAVVSAANYDWVGEYDTEDAFNVPYGVYTDPIPAGPQVAYIYGFPGTLWQATGKTFLTDESYTLSASLGQRTDSPFAASFLRLYAGTDTSVLANNTLLKQSSISVGPGSGKWFTQSMTFGPTDPGYAGFLSAHQGDPLIIALFANGQLLGPVNSETDWDKVEFSFVPEPTSLTLLGLGGVLLLAWRRKSVRIIAPIAAAVLTLTLAPRAQALTFADFEQPAYPATNGSGSVSILGVDGWFRYGATETATLTPDPAGSGVVTVLEGSQSVLVNGYFARNWGSTVSAITLTQTVFSALAKLPYQGSFYFLSDTVIGSSPAGIEAHADGYFYLFRAGNPNFAQATTVPFVASHEYRLSMAIDILNWQFTPTVENLTLATAPTTIGTFAMFPQGGQQSVAYVQAHGGLLIGDGTVANPGGVYDDIQVEAIPEPTSLALLGLGGLLLLRLRTR